MAAGDVTPGRARTCPVYDLQAGDYTVRKDEDGRGRRLGRHPERKRSGSPQGLGPDGARRRDDHHEPVDPRASLQRARMARVPGARPVARMLTAAKTCTKCREAKPIHEFGMVQGKPGSWCKACNRRSAAEWRAANPDKVRERNRTVNRNPEVQRRHQKRWQQSEAGRASARRTHLKSKYGLSQEDFDRMLTEQGGRCSLCDVAPDRLVVDHDHDTGRVRALLCDPCNRGLAAFRDNAAALVRAADYVRVWREV